MATMGTEHARKSRGSAVPAQQDDSLQGQSWTLLLVAWLIALLSTLSALFIGEVMGQAPCNLCWFQRAFMFPLAIILAVACLYSDLSAWRYALPIAVAGWAIAVYHMALYAGLIPAALEPCGDGPSCASTNMLLFGRLPIPLLSLAAFTAITTLLNRIRRSSAT